MHHRTPSWPVGRLALLALAAVLPLLAATAGHAASFANMDPVTPFGVIVNDTYQLMMWICIGILVVVEATLVYAIFKFRKKAGEQREPESWSHNTTLEVVWTIIPFVLLIIICVPTFKGLMYMVNLPKNPDLVLEVVGRQFFWEYRYPTVNATFNSTMRTEAISKYAVGSKEWNDIALHVPINQKILVKFTAADVIHAWWVPAFGMQQMTTPGNLVQFPLEVTKTGAYAGGCAYLCGAYHGQMDIKVKAVEKAEFDAWVQAHQAPGAIEPVEKVGKVGAVYERPKSPEHGAAPGQEHAAEPAAAAVDTAALAKQGEAIYSSRCAGCHQATGAGIPGVFPPLAGAEQVNGEDKDLAKILVHGLNGAIKVKGTDYNGAMPAFGGQLSDQEIAAVATYVRSQWGNNGKPLLPDQVKSAR
ncbi:MAG: cytochrome c oxidase subunit II [Candidatus Sericytochromatia bacterium]|nr:cytochrome c oxidase subunit II [Candidatus Sericytochromatia bacterium]